MNHILSILGCTMLAIVSLLGAAMPGGEAPTPMVGGSTTVNETPDLQEKKKTFDFSGQAQVRCADGTCRVVSSFGAVYAYSSREAEIQAAARVRAEAGRHGTVIEGTITVDVKIRFTPRGEQAEADVAVTTLTYDAATLPCVRFYPVKVGWIGIRNNCGRPMKAVVAWTGGRVARYTVKAHSQIQVLCETAHGELIGEEPAAPSGN